MVDMAVDQRAIDRINQGANPLPRLAELLTKQSKYYQKEAEFLEQVIELAHLTGWLVAHFRPAKTEKGWRTAVSADGKGFPDLVLTRNSDIYFVELKSQEGKLTPEQKGWLDTLDKNPTVRCFVWRPSDWDEMIDELT